jgi:hypothetical protein
MTPAEQIAELLQANEDEGWIVTGFVVVSTAIHPDHELDGTQGYSYTSAPTQPIHATKGLLQMGQEYYSRGDNGTGE